MLGRYLLLQTRFCNSSTELQLRDLSYMTYDKTHVRSPMARFRILDKSSNLPHFSWIVQTFVRSNQMLYALSRVFGQMTQRRSTPRRLINRKSMFRRCCTTSGDNSTVGTEAYHRNYNVSRHRLILNGTADEASNDDSIVAGPQRVQFDVHRVHYATD